MRCMFFSGAALCVIIFAASAHRADRLCAAAFWQESCRHMLARVGVLSALPAHNTLHRRVRMHAHVLRCARAARPLHLRGNAPPRAHIIMSPSKPAHIDSHAFTIALARARLTAFGFDGVRAEAGALRLRTCARARVRLHATAVADAATAPTKPMHNSARAPAHAKCCEQCVLFNADCVTADVTAC